MLKKNLLILVLPLFLIAAASYGLTVQIPDEHFTNDSEKLSQQIHLLENTPLPKGPWPLAGGSEFDPETLRGKYVLINFWASWCPPCIIEFPSLIDFAENHPEYTVVFISNDFDSGAIKKFYETLDPEKKSDLENLKNIITLHDPDGLIMRDRFQTYRLPESYVATPDLQLKAKIISVIGDRTFEYLSRLPHKD